MGPRTQHGDEKRHQRNEPDHGEEPHLCGPQPVDVLEGLDVEPPRALPPYDERVHEHVDQGKPTQE